VTANDRQKTEYTKNKQEHTVNKTTEITQTGIRKLHTTTHDTDSQYCNSTLHTRDIQQ